MESDFETGYCKVQSMNKIAIARNSFVFPNFIRTQ